MTQSSPKAGYKPGRHFLQIPGPTNVPDRVLRAIDAPTIDHRGPTFQKLGLEVLEGIKAVFQTTNPVIIYSATGTGAWQVANFGHHANSRSYTAHRLACEAACAVLQRHLADEGAFSVHAWAD